MDRCALADLSMAKILHLRLSINFSVNVPYVLHLPVFACATIHAALRHIQDDSRRFAVMNLMTELLHLQQTSGDFFQPF